MAKISRFQHAPISVVRMDGIFLNILMPIPDFLVGLSFALRKGEGSGRQQRGTIRTDCLMPTCTYLSGTPHGRHSSTGWQVPTSVSQPPGLLACKFHLWAVIFQNLHLHGAPASNVSQTTSIHLICTNLSQQDDRALCIILPTRLVARGLHPASAHNTKHTLSPAPLCGRLQLSHNYLRSTLVCLKEINVTVKGVFLTLQKKMNDRDHKLVCPFPASIIDVARHPGHDDTHWQGTLGCSARPRGRDRLFFPASSYRACGCHSWDAGGITMPAAVIRSKTLHDEKAMWACHPGPCGRQGIAVRTLSREVVSPTWAQDSDALGS